jgi:hypothetical protein
VEEETLQNKIKILQKSEVHLQQKDICVEEVPKKTTRTLAKNSPIKVQLPTFLQNKHILVRKKGLK